MLHIKIYQNGFQGKVSCERGALLSRVLSEQGFFVPHPCGGRGSCKKCRVSVNGVEVLACRHLLDSDATVVLPSIEQVRSETGGDDSHRLTERVVFVWTLEPRPWLLRWCPWMTSGGFGR